MSINYKPDFFFLSHCTCQVFWFLLGSKHSPWWTLGSWQWICCTGDSVSLMKFWADYFLFLFIAEPGWCTGPSLCIFVHKRLSLPRHLDQCKEMQKYCGTGVSWSISQQSLCKGQVHPGSVPTWSQGIVELHMNSQLSVTLLIALHNKFLLLQLAAVNNHKTVISTSNTQWAKKINK